MTPVDGWLDQRTGAARLVTHHEVPFFVAVEGFARVLAPAVVAHHRGPSSLRRCDPSSVCFVVVVREPPAEGGDQRIQVRSRCHSGVFAGWHVGGDAPDRDACPKASYNADISSSHHAELRDATTTPLGAE